MFFLFLLKKTSSPSCKFVGIDYTPENIMISKVVKIFFVESKYKGTYKIEY
jgi:hypothetical protein